VYEYFFPPVVSLRFCSPKKKKKKKKKLYPDEFCECFERGLLVICRSIVPGVEVKGAFGSGLVQGGGRGVALSLALAVRASLILFFFFSLSFLSFFAP